MKDVSHEIQNSKCVVIVAHPDDETLWAGGTILMNPENQWTIITLCRRDDPDRNPKFYAALKILMNRSRKMDVSMQIALDGHLIAPDHDQISFVPGWHEIPLEKSLVDGKSSVHVYIRSSGKGYVQIWGDQDTLNQYSTFHLHTTNDLSEDEGQQRGEYIIRLVLRP